MKIFEKVKTAGKQFVMGLTLGIDPILGVADMLANFRKRPKTVTGIISRKIDDSIPSEYHGYDGDLQGGINLISYSAGMTIGNFMNICCMSIGIPPYAPMLACWVADGAYNSVRLAKKAVNTEGDTIDNRVGA